MGNPHASPRKTFIAESKGILWQCLALLKSLENKPHDAALIAALTHHFDNLCEPSEAVGLSTLFGLAFDARAFLQQAGALTPKRVRSLEKACFYLLGVLSDSQEAQRSVREEWEQPGLGLTELDIVAHDLKAPLGIIRSSAENILSGRSPHPEAALQRIVRQASRGMQLIQDLLIEAAAPLDSQDQALADILEGLRDGWQAQAEEKRITFDMQYPADLTLRVQRLSLEQILDNLMGNAIKFSPPEGRVELRVERQTLPGTERLAALFSISDQGVGIPAGTLPFIFLEGVRGNSQGHGLGLSICKKLCERHGGTIWAESQPAQGTTMRFALPI